jgi:5-enolpyruvylshikimate-3-phosphate synthase
MKASNSKKAEIEQRILTSFEAIDLAKQDAGWIYDKPYRDFSKGWWDLQRYYQDTQDPVMLIAVLDTYLEQTEILRKISDSKEMESDQKRAVFSALRSLEIAMEKILQSVVPYNPEDT